METCQFVINVASLLNTGYHRPFLALAVDVVSRISPEQNYCLLPIHCQDWIARLSTLVVLTFGDVIVDLIQ
jgi:hypothetical protein